MTGPALIILSLALIAALVIVAVRLSRGVPRHSSLPPFGDQIEDDEALRDSLFMMSQAACLAKIGYFTLDLKTGEVAASEEIFRLIQMEPCDKISRHDLLARTHPDDVALIDRELSASIAERRSLDVKYRAKLPDGEIRYLHAKAKITHDAHGAATHALVAVQDITDQTRAEQVLRESEERFRKLYMDAPAMMHSIDRSGKIVSVNKAWLETLGYTESEILGHDSTEFMTESSRRLTIDIIRPKFFAREAIPHAPFQFVRRDGQVVETILSAIPELDESGNVIRGMAVLRDVTSQKKAELALAQSEMKYRTLIETTDTGYAILDADGKVIDANREFTRLSGHTEVNQILGRNVLEWTDPALRSKNREAIQRCLLDGSIRSFEIDYVKPDGVVTPIEVFASTIEAEGSRRILALCRDISARRRADQERVKLEEQLRESQKLELIGTLAAGIAHDFNNLLVPIVGYSELVASYIPPGSETSDFVSEIIRAAYRAKGLVSQILTFGQQHSGEKQNFSLASLTKEVGKLMQSSFDPSVSIVRKIDTGTSPVYADPAQMHQLLMNLCVNAGQAMAHGGTLTITLHNLPDAETSCPACGENLIGPFVHLAVQDTGHGMSADTMKRVFEPFFTTKPPGQGSGLGLAITHGIVAQHGGHICVESRLGVGSTFHVLLPAAAVPGVPPLRDSVHDDHGSESILVVDDSTDVAMIVSKTLKSLGYRVTTRSSPADALEEFRTSPAQFDVVLADYNMPGMKGDQLAVALLHINPEARVILFSSYNDLPQLKNAKGLGIKDVLTKPVPSHQLHISIRNAMDSPARTPALA